MDAMIYTVIDLNNRGVSYLEQGDHELARVSFKDALERTTYLLNLKQEAEERLGREAFLAQCERLQSQQSSSLSSSSLSATTASSTASTRNCPLNSSSLQPSYHSFATTATTAIASSLNHQHQHQHPHSSRRCTSNSRTSNHNAIQRVPISTTLTSRDTGSFIYSHALLLSRECCTSPAADEYCHRESSVIMFNLALVHHWRGMHFGVTSLLPKALKLYEMSYSLIQNGAAFETHHLVLALLNNMGQIHHELTQYAEAEHCFKNLKDLLASGASQVLDGPEVQGFLMNIMFLEAPSMAPAA